MIRPLRYPRFWLASGGVAMVLVLVFALVPMSGVPGLDVLSDKTLHFFVFMLLMIWFSGVFRLRMSPLVALGLAGFGVLIEVLQAQLPYRSAELADALFDFGGIATGWLFAIAGLGGWIRWVEARVAAGTRR